MVKGNCEEEAKEETKKRFIDRARATPSSEDIASVSLVWLHFLFFSLSDTRGSPLHKIVNKLFK
jgi:hydroxyacyl-ACP dehydratase HTD2-like protein with hotdog domain